MVLLLKKKTERCRPFRIFLPVFNGTYLFISPRNSTEKFSHSSLSLSVYFWTWLELMQVEDQFYFASDQQWLVKVSLWHWYILLKVSSYINTDISANTSWCCNLYLWCRPRGGLTIVPTVPWHGPPLSGAPYIVQFLTRNITTSHISQK